ncbi:MAG: hypothetical protein ACT4O0_12440 [Pseudonocardia sp.]
MGRYGEIPNHRLTADLVTVASAGDAGPDPARMPELTAALSQLAEVPAQGQSAVTS